MIPIALLSSLALAGDFAWDVPPGTRLSYHAEGALGLPNGLFVQATEGIEAWVISLEVALDLDCAAVEEKKGFALHCDITGAALGGLPRPGDEERAPKILAEYAGLLSDATIDVRFTPDGRVIRYDLDGLPDKDTRKREMGETMRQVTRRLFALLDFQTPAGGDDGGKPWRQKGSPLLLELPYGAGVTGGTALSHRVAGRDGATVEFVTEGGGTMQQGELGAIVKLEVTGDGRFDADGGRLLYRGVTVVGNEVGATGGSTRSAYYDQAVWLGLVHPDGTIEGPSGPVPPK